MRVAVWLARYAEGLPCLGMVISVIRVPAPAVSYALSAMGWDVRSVQFATVCGSLSALHAAAPVTLSAPVATVMAESASYAPSVWEKDEFL